MHHKLACGASVELDVQWHPGAPTCSVTSCVHWPVLWPFGICSIGSCTHNMQPVSHYSKSHSKKSLAGVATIIVTS